MPFSATAATKKLPRGKFKVKVAKVLAEIFSFAAPREFSQRRKIFYKLGRASLKKSVNGNSSGSRRMSSGYQPVSKKSLGKPRRRGSMDE